MSGLDVQLGVVDGVLSLPFGSCGIVGNDGVDAIVVRELRVANLLPAAIGPPEFHRSNGIEVAAEVVGRVHVDPCHAFCASATAGYAGAVVATVLLQNEVADVDGGVILAATEVEHQFHVVDVHTRHVALEEHIILASLQVYTVGEEDGHHLDGILAHDQYLLTVREVEGQQRL